MTAACAALIDWPAAAVLCVGIVCFTRLVLAAAGVAPKERAK
jgi:hypothetical protein